MAAIKTAISIEQPLFQEMETLAKEMAVSRSHLFGLAARDFIQRHKSRRLLAAINAAHIEGDNEEADLSAIMKSKHRRLIKGQW
jgi:metal-responsive CopG/Arc/MetJ family transcriptional regulator